MPRKDLYEYFFPTEIGKLMVFLTIQLFLFCTVLSWSDVNEIGLRKGCDIRKSFPCLEECGLKAGCNVHCNIEQCCMLPLQYINQSITFETLEKAHVLVHLNIAYSRDLKNIFQMKNFSVETGILWPSKFFYTIFFSMSALM